MSFFKSEGFNVYCLVVSRLLHGRLNFLPAAAYYWHCGRIECNVLSTAAVSCGSQSVLSTMVLILSSFSGQNTTESQSTLSEVGGWALVITSILRYAWQHEYGRGLLICRKNKIFKTP
jgi:hypothetical protein